MIKIVELSFSPDEYIDLPDDPLSDCGEKDLLSLALRAGGFEKNSAVYAIILKKSIDARRKNKIAIKFSVQLTDSPVSASAEAKIESVKTFPRPVVIGFGPSGIFAALTLARSGLRPVIIERGCRIEDRVRHVAEYLSGESLKVYSNIQFGEGGAGTFSDGKLYSGISDPRKAYVINTLVEFGAPSEIRYVSHPHVGSDRLRDVVINIRKRIEEYGGEFLFERTVTDFVIEKGRIIGVYHCESVSSDDRCFLETNDVIMCIGHSARDTFRVLKSQNINLLPKPFSIGLRIEHKQKWINQSQYDQMFAHPSLPPANYKLVTKTSTGRSLYTFCMCPGGYVIPAASSNESVVTNGMSNFSRDAENANSAVLVGVNPDDFSGADALSGVDMQEELEKRAFFLGGRNGFAPCQRVEDYIMNRPSSNSGEVIPSYRPGVCYTNIREILPEYISKTISEGIQLMGRKIECFSHPDSLLTGVETRSSSPVRIIRNEMLVSPDADGLFPCGEGAGYSGGIMSSAIDGIKCAEMVCLRAGLTEINQFD
jgi:hypothetical protein